MKVRVRVWVRFNLKSAKIKFARVARVMEAGRQGPRLIPTAGPHTTRLTFTIPHCNPQGPSCRVRVRVRVRVRFRVRARV